jgi:hypothetical protein
MHILSSEWQFIFCILFFLINLHYKVAVPSRTDVKEYQALKEEMDQLIGRINGRFSKPNWSPIRYIYGCIPQEQLAAFYRDAAVALVTPLRVRKLHNFWFKQYCK